MNRYKLDTLHLKYPARLLALEERLSLLREQAVRHAVYACIETLEDLHVFVEHHVFAVWDFMSLLKTLQNALTSVTIPWLPRGNRLSRRLINEIVLVEESDEIVEMGGYSSHFELYLEGMQQCGANTFCMHTFLRELERGTDVGMALKIAAAPAAARAFVQTTWQIMATHQPHMIAAAFTLGREDVIPDMFRSIVNGLEAKFPGQLTLFRTYLERHIDVDEEEHTPMAFQMLEELCGASAERWHQAQEAAQLALQARLALWNGIQNQLGVPVTCCRGDKLPVAQL